MTDHSNIPDELAPRASMGCEVAASSPCAFRFDFARYMQFLAGYDLTEAQKLRLLEALGVLVLGVTDDAFGTHPVQQACGKRDKELAPKAGKDSDRARIEVQALTATFNKAASGRRKRKR